MLVEIEEREHKIVGRMVQILTEVWGESNLEHVVCTQQMIPRRTADEGLINRLIETLSLRATCVLRLGNVRKGSFRRTPS